MAHDSVSKLIYSSINPWPNFYAYRSRKEKCKKTSSKCLPRKNTTDTQILFYLIKSVQLIDLLKFTVILVETEK